MDDSFWDDSAWDEFVAFQAEVDEMWEDSQRELEKVNAEYKARMNLLEGMLLKIPEQYKKA